MVHPSTAISILGQGVAQCVSDLSRLKLLRLNFPYFFDAETVGLMLTVAAEVVFLDDLLSQAAVAALTEERDAGVELHTALEGVFGLAFSRDSKIIGRNTLDYTLVVVEDFRCGESWVDFHAHFFRSLTKPFDHLVQTDDVVTVVVHLWRLW